MRPFVRLEMSPRESLLSSSEKNSFAFRVETIDGSAVVDEDYVAVNEILTFEPNEREKEVRS